MEIKTSQPRKQRQRMATLPDHQTKRRVGVHLSKELKTSLGVRNVTIRKGDLVRVVRGSHKPKEGKISSVDRQKGKVVVEGITIKKTDGSEVAIKINTSNLVVLSLELSDKKRFKNKPLKKALKVQEKKAEPKTEKKTEEKSEKNEGKKAEKKVPAKKEEKKATAKKPSKPKAKKSGEKK